MHFGVETALFHLPDPKSGLREAHRVLRAGGAIGVVVWGVDSAMPDGAIWSEELDAAGAAPDPRDPAIQQHALMDTPEKLAGLLDECGFGEPRVRGGRFEHPFTVSELLAIQYGTGMAGRRLRSLPAERAETCRARAVTRLERLTPAELVHRPEVVWGVATAEASIRH